jgi:hypothetical protein
LPDIRRGEKDEFRRNGTLVAALHVLNRGQQQRAVEVGLALKERDEIENRFIRTLVAGNVSRRAPAG